MTKVFKPDSALQEALKMLTKEDIKKAFSPEASRERRKKADDLLRKKEEEKYNKTGICVFCKGKVVTDVGLIQHGPVIIGPGNRMSKVIEGYHCTSCGLMYDFIPPTKQKIKKKK